jgi:hypothetical protein
MISQALNFLLPLAFGLMTICVILNSTIVRFVKAGGAPFQEALKRVTATRCFWIEIICSILSLVGLILVRLQEHSLFVSVLESLAVVLVVTTVLAIASFWSAGLLLKREREN